jgi:hypothetical protein
VTVRLLRQDRSCKPYSLVPDRPHCGILLLFSGVSGILAYGAPMVACKRGGVGIRGTGCVDTEASCCCRTSSSCF